MYLEKKNRTFPVPNINSTLACDLQSDENITTYADVSRQPVNGPTECLEDDFHTMVRTRNFRCDQGRVAHVMVGLTGNNDELLRIKNPRYIRNLRFLMHLHMIPGAGNSLG